MPPKSSKKSGKGRERKLKRKQEQAEIATSWEKVKAAYKMGNFMDYFLPFQTYNRNGLNANISFCYASEVPEQDEKWMFDLLKENMKRLYVLGGWGWNDRKKWDELTHESSCYLLARDITSHQLLGFVSFRFDLDQDIEVLYCYEIQLISEVRRKGLGKFFMQILELIAHKTSMRKVVLTVFKGVSPSNLENIGSNRFFREKMGYLEDESSPSLTDPLNPDEYSYSILSKLLFKPSAGHAPTTDHSLCTECSGYHQ